MLYNIVYVDSGAFCEIPPIIHTIELNDEEFENMKKIVEDFEDERYPFFYPQMYIYKINSTTFSEINEFIFERFENMKVWKQKNEKKEETRSGSLIFEKINDRQK